jgi:hypothetical protein
MIKSHKHIALVAALLVAAPAMVAGQEHGAVAGQGQEDGKGVRASAPSSFCFNGAPQSKCATFVIAEMQGSTPLFQTKRQVRWGGGTTREDGSFEYDEGIQTREEVAYGERLQWELGLMHNVSDRWALGATARLGSGSTGAVSALTARARRWMSDDIAIDVAAGTSFSTDWESYSRNADFTADARLNFRDDVYVGLRYDQVGLPAYSDEYGGFDAGGKQRAVSLLAGVGSEWALGGSAAVGLGMILLLSLVDWE